MPRPTLFALPLLLPALTTQAQSTPPRPAVTGIAFARLYTTHPAAAQHFYADTLGLPQTKLPDKVVYPVNQSQWVELIPTTNPPHATNRLAATAFTTRDASAMARYLTAHNIPIEIPLKHGEFAVRDPENNLIYFVQAKSNPLVARAPLSPNAASHRLIHAGFLVQDPEKENTFYRDLLGFTPNWHGGRKPGVDDWISYTVPDGSDWLEYMLNDGPHPTLKQSGGADHISLGTIKMDTVIAALAHNHCEGADCTAARMGLDGKVQLNLYDPDQTRIEFMEFSPTGPVCCSPITGKTPTEKEEN